MSSAQKVALSFLITLILFAGFVFFGQTGLMTKIETNFYASAKVSEKENEIEKISNATDLYITNILNKVAFNEDAYLKNDAVRTFTIQNPSEKDEAERRKYTLKLLDELPDLDGMRLIEDNGRNVHYSTYEEDILKVDGTFKTYKNYTDIISAYNEISADKILINAQKDKFKIFLDKQRNRLIFSFPYYITDSVTRGSFVLYFNFYNITQSLINQGVLAIGESFNIVSDENLSGGFVAGLPRDSQNEFIQPVLEKWKTGSTNDRILQSQDNAYYLLLTNPFTKYIKISAVYKSSIFELSKEFIYLIYTCVFITILLICLLLFNIKQDYLTKIRSRIKKVQMGIINEYLENKETIEWSVISRQLDLRKEELSEEIKKSIGGKAEKYSQKIDDYINSSWDEIINVLSSNAKTKESQSQLSGASIDEIRKVIEEVLISTRLHVNLDQISAPGTQVTPVTVKDSVQSADDIETIEEIEEISEAEPIEEIEEIPDAEPVEDIEEIVDAVPVEDLDEVEAVEEVEEISDAVAINDENLEELPEYVPAPSAPFIKAVQKYDYIECEDTFMNLSTDDFASFDNIFAECLCIGPEYTYDIEKKNVEYKFIVEKPKFTVSEEDVIEVLAQEQEIEETAELIPEGQMFYTMTEFGAKILPVTELQSENTDTIVENKGVYSISDNISYKDVVQDKKFKKLVDSVLK